MKNIACLIFALLMISLADAGAQQQLSPDQIEFVRQGVRRFIFDPDQSIPLAALNPSEIIGLSAMYPVIHHLKDRSNVSVRDDELVISSTAHSETSIWFGGFNPFATYTIQLGHCSGSGEVGFRFSDTRSMQQCFVLLEFDDQVIIGANLKILSNSEIIAEEPIAVNVPVQMTGDGEIILQMLGSGFTLFYKEKGYPVPVGQCDFNQYLDLQYFDLRSKACLRSFNSSLFMKLAKGSIGIRKASSAFTTGVGLADIRAITYENGDPLMDQNRLWYTMSIRGRALPHHIQGVFSMSPGVFDLKLEGIIVFDRNDGILRNEIASHIFYDRNEQIWRGYTTGFSAYANPDNEKKQLLAVESKADPRFGFSMMEAKAMGMVGDIEDPGVVFDKEEHKWRMIACERLNGYQAVLLESDQWDQGFRRIAGPVEHNSTGTSIQKIGDRYYCFSGSSEREIFIYSYPELEEIGTLKMDLPPWSDETTTRVWPNVVQLPDTYPFRYIALMMDRFKYPGLKGPHWSYGAVYLYHGYE